MQLRCRCWECPYCRPRRQKRLKWQARSGDPKTFITLTCNVHRWNGPGEAARAMSRAWRLARARIEREYGGKKGEYLTVVEATKLGWPHFHVLTTRPWIDQKWLSALWDELTGAPVVDIKRVTNSRMAASYVAKYLGKAPHRFLHMKRYYFTRGYVKPREDDGQKIDWSGAVHEEIGGQALTLASALLKSGWRLIESANEFFVLERGPPGLVCPLPGALAIA
jgi:hypothetical protein